MEEGLFFFRAFERVPLDFFLFVPTYIVFFRALGAMILIKLEYCEISPIPDSDSTESAEMLVVASPFILARFSSEI